jgi:protein archease
MMARALFTLIADLDSVRPLTERVISLRADDLPGMLRDWLAELNYLHEVHGEVYCRFEPTIADGRLEARVSGEPLDIARHDPRHEVKAITRHDLVVERVQGGWRGHVLLDV